MWVPTHVVLTVRQATGLLTKGHNNTNNCFVVIALGKVKFQTSVKVKASSTVEWLEECELPIPDQGNTAEIILTILHRNLLSVDEFLGRIVIPLANFNVYQKPKYIWYTLEAKPGKENKKKRGKIEAMVAFTVKSTSLTDLSKKAQEKASIGGSLLSLGSLEKRKGLKKFTKSLGSKLNLKNRKKKDFDSDSESINGSISNISRRNGIIDDSRKISQQFEGSADPGVISEDENENEYEDEFRLDDLSCNNSQSSLNQVQEKQITTNIKKSIEPITDDKIPRRHTFAALPKKLLNLHFNTTDEWSSKLNKNNFLSKSKQQLDDKIEEESMNECKDNASENEKSEEKEKEQPRFSIFKHFKKNKSLDNLDRIIVGEENKDESKIVNNKISSEMMQVYKGIPRDDLILLVCDLQSDLNKYKQRLSDLENYLDDLLLRVMETTPYILQNPTEEV